MASFKKYLNVKNLIENADLNINSWLIKWGFINGYLKDGQIHTTKFTIIYQWTVIMILSLHTIKFTIFLFSKKESKITNQLGDWSYFFAPRLVMNGIVLTCFVYIFLVMIYFKFCLRNLKDNFYWLNIMEYHTENRGFFNLNLNKSDLKIFIKRISLFAFSLEYLVFSFIMFFALTSFISIFKYINDYQLNYLISVIINLAPCYYCIAYLYGLPVILYLVSLKLIYVNKYK